MASRVVVIDNGGSSVKAGFDNCLRPQLKILNCLSQSKKSASTYVIGDDKIATLNSTGYIVHRPVKAGVLVEVDKQAIIWRHVFDRLNIRPDNFKELGLSLTEVYGTPPSVHQELEEFFFEECGFSSAIFLQSEVMAHYAFPTSYDGITLCAISNSKVDGFYEWEFDWNPLKSRSLHKLKYRLFSSHPGLFVPPTRLCCNLGYSGMSLFPMVKETVVDYAIHKNYAGGRALDAEFKRIICLRKAKLEFFDLAIRQLREKACVLSKDIASDVQTAARQMIGRVSPEEPSWNPGSLFVQEIGDLLGHPTKLPASLPSEIVLGPERFSIYEKLFSPNFGIGDSHYCVNETDAKMTMALEGWRPRVAYPTQIEVHKYLKPCGLPAIIKHAIFACPPIIQSDVCNSIVMCRPLSGICFDIPFSWRFGQHPRSIGALFEGTTARVANSVAANCRDDPRGP
eukprot:Gregarina_sp_Poly_1__1325@NODE_1328_length_4370_cov_45_596328_g433_i1_p2_GENE_NODE_1328_length_4370_cov_45_596328_g433_i1NODE_1328_length_4370_cov_45_596328_g433_i1_p2_ORF_typecomplete_len454_score38_26Actin/PF00022_19/2_8e35_NODE_1328_length_4370_cov_45_596328_g433_i1761437